jgi:hypothetical protein
MKHATKFRFVLLVGITISLLFVGCTKTTPTADEANANQSAKETPAPTNRIDIPSAVRQNLGITFARVEQRQVGQIIRVPGRFELLSTARREIRSPLKGNVELLVEQYQRIEIGTPLFRMDSAAWGDLHEQISAMTSRVQSMEPLRKAHRVHEKSLAEKVQLWQDRLAQLQELRAAGGGSASQFVEVRASLIATEAELSEIMEKDAELEAQQKTYEAELRALRTRRDLILKATGLPSSPQESELTRTFTVFATAPGIVESLNANSGGLVEDSGLVMTIVQPDQIRFRARGMQTDLGRLQDELVARIVAPQGGSMNPQESMSGVLQIGLVADADERTIDLVVRPEKNLSWARAGVSAQLEIALVGGQEGLAIPNSAIVRDGATPFIFRRDPLNPDIAIRLEADVGLSDGRWTLINSGVKEGDEIVLDGNYQLMLASSGNAASGGHFHSDGTFHEGKD